MTAKEMDSDDLEATCVQAEALLALRKFKAIKKGSSPLVRHIACLMWCRRCHGCALLTVSVLKISQNGDPPECDQIFRKMGLRLGCGTITVSAPTSPHEAAIDRLAGGITRNAIGAHGATPASGREPKQDAAVLLLASNREADDRSRPQPVPVLFSMSVGWLSFALAFLVCTLVASLWSTWLIAFPTPERLEFSQFKGGGNEQLGKDAFDTATHTAIRKAVWRIDLSKYWFFLICGSLPSQSGSTVSLCIFQDADEVLGDHAMRGLLT